MRYLYALLFFTLFLTASPFEGKCSPTGEHAAIPATPSLEIMAGQMIMSGFRGTGNNPEADDLPYILDDIRSGRVGGVILFERDWKTRKAGRNVVSVSQVSSLSALLRAAAPIPLFIAIDQEGGKVRRLKPEHGFPESASAQSLGALSSASSGEAGATMGAALHAAGISLNFAPVADVSVNPDSPAIGRLGRAFSSDPRRAAEHAAAFAGGLAESGVIACYKHFPGHGSATTDTHNMLTDITKTWKPEELLPYRPESLPDGARLMVMTGHLVHRDMDPDYPATLSYAITTKLLREELGWQGVIITDDLQMGAIAAHYTLEETVRLAILAGADILLFGNNLRHDPLTARTVHSLLLEMVRRGEIPRARIEESWRRIRDLKLRQFQENS